MDYRTLCHRAFYNPEMRGDYTGCRVSFTHYESNDETSIYSYSTVVARVVHDRDGRKVTLLTNAHYSVTTSGHVSAIASASPYTIIRVPDCETRDMVGTFKRALEAYTIEHGTRLDYFKYADQRKGFLQLLEMFDYYQERVGGLDELLPLRNTGMVACWERLCLAIENKTMSRKEAIEQAREGFVVAQDEQRKIEAERERIRRKKEAAAKRRRTLERKATEKQLGEAMTDPSILRWAFTYQSHLTEKEYQKQQRLRRALNSIEYDINSCWGPKGASYVWVENDQEVKTSQSVTCKIGVVKRLASMWLQKCDIIGQDCDGYTVVMNNADFVKVGCHVIPTWNVMALCKQLNLM